MRTHRFNEAMDSSKIDKNGCCFIYGGIHMQCEKQPEWIVKDNDKKYLCCEFHHEEIYRYYKQLNDTVTMSHIIEMDKLKEEIK